jgi:hypothetical protein
MQSQYGDAEKVSLGIALGYRLLYNISVMLSGVSGNKTLQRLRIIKTYGNREYENGAPGRSQKGGFGKRSWW